MTDQEKQEKVIKGLECAIDENHNGFKNCHSCQYRKDIDHLQYVCDGDRCIADAIALLKAQEARVLTLEEALNSLVIEYRSGKLQEVGKRVFTKGFKYYGDLWRVWDRMPTDEQREATPWQQ